ncbi:uncharacterized protein BDV14DRAFT_201795 [Aspergillus stella-maris]|uniref:uncharacterized protein n=1 Tax=Aspergillus stella-maris TaxID=1810926 RepID=UPI003CCCBECE
MSEPPKNYEDFTVVWICTLSVEAAAARTMLDKVHPRLTHGQTAANQYIYALGEISGLNIVIACLPSAAPEPGALSAAVLLSQILSAFSGIKYGIMVGVASGIPKTVDNDMWLGDVVVSEPTKEGTLGVVACDLRKAPSEDGEYQVTAVNNRPPQFLLDVVSQMQSESEHLEIGKAVSQALDTYPDMVEQFSMPERTTDLLYERDYSHRPDEPDCQKCEEQYLVDCTPRTTEEPRVHYGLIASGSQPLQDSTARDRLAEQNGMLCLDQIQSPDLLHQLPFFAIRGVCDYGDSHRSKRWQGYAAMTAAAYAKILLSRVRQLDNIEINRLSPSSALSLLKETLLDKALAESEEAVFLVDKLQCFSSAIKQAAGYINENHISINEYLSLLNREEESMLELLGQGYGDEWRNSETRSPMINTWMVSLRQIQKLDNLATDYLSFMSCVSPAWIPLPLFLAAESNARQQSALGLLKAYHFIAEHEESVWRSYLPHGQYLLDGTSFEGSKLDRAELAQKISWCMFLDGRHREAEVLVRDALATREVLLGPEDLMNLNGLQLLSMCLWGYENYGAAEKVLLETLERLRRRSLDSNPIDIVTAKNLLARIYIGQGRYKEAETILADVDVHLKEQELGDSHQHTLQYMLPLGVAYSRQKKYRKAEEILLDVLPKFITVHGCQSIQSMDIKRELADVYLYQSRLSEAEDLVKERLNYLDCTYGPYHEHTFLDRWNLLHIYRQQRRIEDAKSLGTHLRTQTMTVLGPAHQITLMTAGELSLIYIDEGNDQGAEKVLPEALYSMQCLGYAKDDELTRLHMSLLAQVKARLGRLAEAESIYKNLIELQTSKLGLEDLDTLTYTQGLASTYNQQRRYKESEQLQRQVLTAQKKVLGEDHPDRLSSMSVLAAMLRWGLRRKRESEAVQEECTRLTEKRFGPDHPDTIESKERLEEWRANLDSYAPTASDED